MTPPHPGRLHRPRLTVPAFVLLAAALAGPLAGCAGTDAAPTVATAVTATPTARATGAADPVARYVEAQRRYVRCMRDAGVELPDPDAKGAVDYGSDPKRKTDPVFIAAQEECRKHRLPMPRELAELPRKSPTEIRWARDYARCMRSNGVPAFRDPDPSGYFEGEGTDPGEGLAEGVLLRAGQVCEPVLAGRPPTSPNPHASGQG